MFITEVGALLPTWTDVQCPNGDTFRMPVRHEVVRTDRKGNRYVHMDIPGLDEALREHLQECQWLNADVIANDIYELHPAGTMVGFEGEVYEVGLDGLWRNRYGQQLAGQEAVTPDPPRHCPGCRCDERSPGVGRRMPHGGEI